MINAKRAINTAGGTTRGSSPCHRCVAIAPAITAPSKAAAQACTRGASNAAAQTISMVPTAGRAQPGNPQRAKRGPQAVEAPNFENPIKKKTRATAAVLAHRAIRWFLVMRRLCGADSAAEVTGSSIVPLESLMVR